MRLSLFVVGLLCVACALAACLPGTPVARAQQTTTVRVSTRVIEPFVMERGGALTGFSIDLWHEIALRNGWRSEFTVIDTIDNLLDDVRSGQSDLAVAAISMTPEREQTLDYSYPIFNAGLQVMTLATAPQWFEALHVSALQLLGLIGGLLALMTLVAHVVWLLERRANSEFAANYWPGVWEAFWWSGVTLTTVGYGDKTPRSVAGRVLALVWMFTGLVLAANFTAQITSQLTVRELSGKVTSVDELPGRRVMTVEGSTAARFLELRGIAYRGVARIEEAYGALESGQIDAIVYDAPILLYRIAQRRESGLRLVGEVFQPEPYGIAFPNDSPLREPVNRALLEIITDGTYNRLYRLYFQNVASDT